ncbi:DNA repair exonuclease [Ruegeria sp. HKCCD7559]|uniref:metallophosphoesterase family protein n=1 Tax=Ruegeria TaxID=97050 RepID=UPI001490BB4C|nr:DNA repair exonuclease [Ruegeria sp. HKCCD7559]NOC47322.1 DNA repair exonuclease [Ruegeria sp. HKCCD7559]
MKILHTADVHLDSPLKSLALRDPELRERVQTASRAAFVRIVDTAIAEEVTALLIAGDLFDGAERSARTAAFLVIQLERLRECGIRVFYIKGNHDAENPVTGELNLPDNVHVFDGRGGKVQVSPEVWIHGVSFASRHAPDSLLPKFPGPVDGAVNIAMLHSSLAGAEGHDPYAPCSVGDLVSSGYDYWALGHVHRRQIHSQTPWVVMPGMPQGRDMGETGPKSATLISITDEITIEELPTSVVEFLEMPVDVKDLETDDALRDLLRRKLRDAADGLASDDAVIRLKLSGRTPRRWQLLRDQDVWMDTVAQYARETGVLWLDRIVFDLSANDEAANSATDELAVIMKTIRDQAGFAENYRTELEDVLKEIPPQRRTELLPDEAETNRLVLHLAERGAQRLIAKMKGASS